MLRIACVLSVALLLAACGVSLSPAGQAVTLYRGDSVNLLSHCKHLGSVRASSRDSMGSVYHSIRNKAAGLGGDSVAIANQGVGMGGYYATGAVYQCQTGN